MSNPFYSYSGSFIPGTLGRAEAVAAEFQSVQAGFADLAINGVDTGSAAAYVVTTPAGQPATPLVDGDQVSFRAANTNSGAATISVNGLAAAPLLQYNGNGLQAGNIAANSWYTVTYNSSFGGWCLPGAVAITFAGSISSSAPIYPVQLTAVGGSSTSAMPIDAKLALSTAISPTWVGKHSFTGTSSFSGPVTISGTTTISGPLIISAVMTFGAGVAFAGPASFAGTATVSGVLAVSGTSSFSGPSTISGPLTISGTSTSSGPWSFTNKLTVSGTSSFLGPTALTNVTALTVAGTSSFSGPTTFSGTSTFSTIKVTAASTFAGISATTGTFSGVLSAVLVSVTSTQTNGVILSITANPTGNAQHCLRINGSTSGTSYGLFIQAGLVASDSVFYVRAADGSQNFISLAGDGSGQLGGPTGVSLTWSALGAITVGTPTSGVGLTVNGATGTHSTVIDDAAGNPFNAGWLEIPQNAFGTSYASVSSDSGKSQYHNSASAHTFTINDATVNYKVGTTITIINEVGGGTVTIALQTTAANLIWSPSLATGNRTLAAGGIATVTKVTAGTPGVWFLTGVGVN